MINSNLRKRLSILCLCLVSLVFLSSCKDDGVTPASQNASVSLMSSNNGVQDNSVIIIESAKVLMEKVELQNNAELTTIVSGPFVVEINLLGTVNVIGLGGVLPGTYDRVNFKIHKHNPNEPIIDPDFGTGGEVGFSAVITGSYNGVGFVYKSPKTCIQNVAINPPLVVTESSGSEIVVNVTLVCDPSGWFVKNGQILDPMNPENQNDIDNNIKDSFLKAFRDNDRNGVPDS